MKENKRNIYLNSKDLKQAVSILKNSLENKISIDNIDVIHALNRVSAEPIFARICSPYYNASAMDGVCVCYEKTSAANERSPQRLIKNIDYKNIDTGDIIEPPYNAVIMIEDIVQIDEETIEIFAPSSPWQNIRNVGEDIVASELIIPAYHKIRPVDIGALLAGGIRELEVVKKPVVSIITTGSEIIDYNQDIKNGQIVDSNSRMFEAMVSEAGAVSIRYKPIADDYELIKKTVKKACAQSDIVLIGAGSSAGREDYTRAVIEDLGELLLHGAAIKPGKPVVLGKVDKTCVIGIPGYPVSAYFVFEHFVSAAIYELLHITRQKANTVTASLISRVYSSLKHLEFVRVKLGKVSDKLIAAPLNRGAGVTMSLVNADGILRIEKNLEGYEAGKEVEVELMRNIDEIENTLVSIGSHDILLDVLANLLHKQKIKANLSSTHIGSMGGILAFANDQCHIAPIHLLDEKTGEYNIAHIKKYLSDKECVLVKGVKRTQGLMIRRDCKQEIKSIADLTKKAVIFANRQKGSGTRILFDFLLKQKDIDSNQIAGYERELNTHMMVASAVKSASADAGIGVLSAAKATDLLFYEVGEEEYDFLVRKDILDTHLFSMFISALTSNEFKKELDLLGGYSHERIGEIIQI